MLVLRVVLLRVINRIPKEQAVQKVSTAFFISILINDTSLICCSLD
jgi:hypothetical protein